MSPVNTTFNLSPAISKVILAGNDSVPAMAPPAAASATACSIARCELTPTAFRNLRILRFNASSFIRDSRFPRWVFPERCALQIRLVSVLGPESPPKPHPLDRRITRNSPKAMEHPGEEETACEHWQSQYGD